MGGVFLFAPKKAILGEPPAQWRGLRLLFSHPSPSSTSSHCRYQNPPHRQQTTSTLIGTLPPPRCIRYFLNDSGWSHLKNLVLLLSISMNRPGPPYPRLLGACQDSGIALSFKLSDRIPYLPSRCGPPQFSMQRNTKGVDRDR